MCTKDCSLADDYRLKEEGAVSVSFLFAVIKYSGKATQKRGNLLGGHSSALSSTSTVYSCGTGNNTTHSMGSSHPKKHNQDNPPRAPLPPRDSRPCQTDN